MMPHVLSLQVLQPEMLPLGTMEPKLLLSSFPSCLLETKVCFSASGNWKALMYAMEGVRRNSRAVTH